MSRLSAFSCLSSKTKNSWKTTFLAREGERESKTGFQKGRSWVYSIKEGIVNYNRKFSFQSKKLARVNSIKVGIVHYNSLKCLKVHKCDTKLHINLEWQGIWVGFLFSLLTELDLLLFLLPTTKAFPFCCPRLRLVHANRQALVLGSKKGGRSRSFIKRKNKSISNSRPFQVNK